MAAKVTMLEQLARAIAASLDRIEQRLGTGLAHTDGRMGRLDDRLGQIERRLEILWSDQRSNFRWLRRTMLASTGVILAFILCLLGVMAHGFHWL